ncbi:EF-hand domain-containing protein [Planctomicrobium sp. SH661]|uniref:EF-hand domain-containing protein n=1 Tax=Planctomicrobium sp. SH661 TaxID=3448124 RepID=UPI003F5C22A0
MYSLPQRDPWKPASPATAILRILNTILQEMSNMRRATRHQFCMAATLILLLGGHEILGADPLGGDRNAVFEAADTNHDRYLTLAEYQKIPGDPAVQTRDFRVFDFDSSQTLSREEFLAIPSDVPAHRRGNLPDPFEDLHLHAIDGMDESYRWNERPHFLVPALTFCQNYVISLGRPPENRILQQLAAQADSNKDQQTSRSDADRFLKIQLGLQTPSDHQIRFSNGRVAKFAKFQNADTNNDQIVDHAEFFAKWGGVNQEELFQEADKDRDGKISLAEFFTESWSGHDDPIVRFLQADRNLDGECDVEELLAVTPEDQRELVKFFVPAFDQNMNGSLSLTEYRLSPLGNAGTDLQKQLTDESQDGKLDFVEFNFPGTTCHLLHRYYFHRLDRNQDGHLTLDEFPYKLKPAEGFYFLSADGKEYRRFYTNPEYPHCGSPAVSADGELILFDTWKGGQSYGDSRVFQMKIDGTGVRDLCHGLMPTWSPDRTKFTCSRYADGNTVWIMNADGSESKMIAKGWGAQWSPDGKTIAFTRDGGVSAYDVASGEIRDVLVRKDHEYQMIFYNMCWSPDSSRLAFHATDKKGSHIASIAMTEDAPDLQVHYSDRKAIDNDIAWSPEGDRIYFTGPAPPLSGYRLQVTTPEKTGTIVPGIPETKPVHGVCLIPGGKGFIFSSRE